MGVGASKQLALTSAKFPESERYYGLENFGNTCYANSVLQALYFCKPLRQRAIEHSVARRPTTVPTSEGEDEDETLLEALCDLFREISTQKKRVGVIPPRRFMQRLRADNQVFNSFMHQDAHELLNYLLNEVADILEKRNKQAAEPAVEDAADPNADAAGACAASTASIAGVGSTPNRSAAKRGIAGGSSSSSSEYACKTWIHSIFEGLLVNETRCLSCDKVTSRDESFLDLSLEIKPNSTVADCLRDFSRNESMRADNKFYCDCCLSLQEAHKRMRIKRLPNVLALHLKRFKYFEQHQLKL
jgi:ubiquitin carboxyl-terminal hydrolase 12/46